MPARVLQVLRIRKIFSAATGLPFWALRCRRLYPDVAATLVVFITAVKSGQSGCELAKQFLEMTAEHTNWMAGWLGDYETAKAANEAKYASTAAAGAGSGRGAFDEMSSHHSDAMMSGGMVSGHFKYDGGDDEEEDRGEFDRFSDDRGDRDDDDASPRPSEGDDDVVLGMQ